MRYLFVCPCRVGMIMPDGNMVSMTFEAGTVVEPHTVTDAPEAEDQHELALDDGTLLVNVPRAAIVPCQECAATA